MPLWKYDNQDLQKAAVRAFGDGSQARSLTTGLWVRVTKPDGTEGTLNSQQVQGYLNEYNTATLTDLFHVHGFLAPYVEVTRKSDGQKGYLQFQHFPRMYFNFQPIR